MNASALCALHQRGMLEPNYLRRTGIASARDPAFHRALPPFSSVSSRMCVRRCPIAGTCRERCSNVSSVVLAREEPCIRVLSAKDYRLLSDESPQLMAGSQDLHAVLGKTVPGSTSLARYGILDFIRRFRNPAGTETLESRNILTPCGHGTANVSAQRRAS